MSKRCRQDKEVEGESKPSLNEDLKTILDEKEEEEESSQEELRHVDMDIVEKPPDTTLPGREMQIALLIKLLTGVSQTLVLSLHLMHQLNG